MAKAKKLPSGNWRVRVYAGKDENGKAFYQSFTAATKKEAEYLGAEFALYRKDLKNPLNLTLSAAIDEYIKRRENQLSPSTIKNYRKIQRTRFQSLMACRLSAIDKDKLQTAVNKEALLVAPKTVHNSYGLISSTIREFIDDFNPKIRLPKKIKPQYATPSPQQLEQLFAAAKGSDVELPILLASTMSLRMSEIKGLKWSDINGNIAHINEAIVQGLDGYVSKSTKSEAGDRYILIPQCVQDLLKTIPQRSKYIVSMPRTTIDKHFKQLLRVNGLPDCRFHDLRHANASAMLLLNIPDKYGMERGGWATRDTYHNIYQQTFTAERLTFDNQINTYFDNLYNNAL